MEVHHPHHLPKNWKEYLKEFLMLFLAISLGFFAENLREHFVEQEKEHQLMESMLADLDKNQELLLSQKNALLKRNSSCDSIAYFLEPSRIKQSGSTLYFHARKIGVYGSQFPLATRSLDQLKNGGMFRLIHKTDIADSLSAYDNLKTQYEQSINWYFDNVKLIQEANKTMFNTKVFAFNTQYTSTYEFNQLRPQDNPALLSYQQQDLDKYYNSVYYLKKHTETILRNIDQLTSYSENLKLAIRKYYH